MVATLDRMKQQCEDYIRQFDPRPENDELPFN